MKSRPVKRAYALGVRAETAKQTKEAIKAAATRAFATRAFDLVSLREIADDAEVTQQTVIRLFGSKEELLATLADEELTRAHALLPALENVDDVEAALRKNVDGYDSVADRAIAFFDAGERHPAIGLVAKRARTVQIAWIERLFSSYLPARAGRRRTIGVAQLYAALDYHAWKTLRTNSGLSIQDAAEAMVSSAMAIARSLK